MIDTATVMSLTAEVRVLMVGNRQVTLSVAKQLDCVPIEEIEPFGRVRRGHGGQEVVGRHTATGALVVASYGLQSLHERHGRDAYMLTVEQRAECKALFDALDSLPLIVLAGLK
jgi:hypothetical protein